MNLTRRRFVQIISAGGAATVGLTSFACRQRPEVSAGRAPINVGQERQLFVDDFLYRETSPPDAWVRASAP